MTRGLDWIVDRARPLPGKKAVFEALYAQWAAAPKGHPDREALGARLREISTTIYDAIGCPIVGRDETADEWMREEVYKTVRSIMKQDARYEHVPDAYRAYWTRPVEQIVEEHAGHPVLALAADKGWAVLSGELSGSPLDFCGGLIGHDTSLPEDIRRDAWKDHDAAEASLYAERIRVSSSKPLSDGVQRAVRWLWYWSAKGFGYRAVFPERK